MELLHSNVVAADRESDFCRRLEYCGRILELEDYHVWCASPIYGGDGRVHVFFSRWPRRFPHRAWLTACEIAHAVAERPEGPYRVTGTVLEGRGGDAWDGWTVHNPTVYRVDGRYAMFYMGNTGRELGVDRESFSLGLNALAAGEARGEAFSREWLTLVAAQRVGLAVADSLDGPWTRVSDAAPLIDTGAPGSWDEVCTTNPAFVTDASGRCLLYYKSLDRRRHGSGNRKYGLAVADSLTGPYRKHPGNPVLDLETVGDNRQCEDAFIWREDGGYRLVMRDMGFFNHTDGLYFTSPDGLNWSEPQIGYYGMARYSAEPLPGLERQGRFERPQVLLQNGRPDYLFCAVVGGRSGTSSAAVFRIASDGSSGPGDFLR